MGLLEFIGLGDTSSIEATTRVQTSVPARIVIPAAGTSPVLITLNIYNNSQSLEDPDSQEIAIQVANSSGTDRTSRMFKEAAFSNALDVIGSGALTGLSKLERVSQGTYQGYYKSSNTDTDETLIFTFKYLENTNLMRLDVGSYADSNGSDLATIESKIDTVDTVVDAIKLVTDALPNGGALTSIAQDSTVAKDATVAKEATLSTVHGKIDIIDTVVDAIKLVTDNLPNSGSLTSLAQDATVAKEATLTAIKGATFNGTTDSLEAIRDTIDALNDPSAADNADAVWDEQTAGHTSAGSFGKLLLDDATQLDTVESKIDIIDTNVDSVLTELASGTYGLSAIKTAVNAIPTDTVGDRKATIDISQNATTSETDITNLNLSTAGRSYTLETLVLKAAATSGNTISVRLYEEVNGTSTLTDTRLIHDTNYTKHLNMIDLFGRDRIASEKIRVTLQSSSGTIAVTGQATYNEAVL